VLLFGYGLKFAGPAANSIGWRVVSLFTLAMAASITIVFMLPPNELVLWTMLTVGIALVAAWGASARRRFPGPKMTSPGARPGPVVADR
jgi:hypothetical protein